MRRSYSTSIREHDLLDNNSRRWSKNLDFYLGEEWRHRDVEFQRGLPWLCTMNPYMFLEQGEYILTRVAPLRGIKFYADPEGDPFPAKELAACPLLARLDEIRFDRWATTEEELEILVSSPHLGRVRAWDFREVQVSATVWESLAANPAARGALMIESAYQVPSDSGPIEEVAGSFDLRPWRYFEVSAEGAALERRYGYLPWLHRANVCRVVDAHYWEAQRVLPVFVPGSPIDAPAPYGTGLRQLQRLIPRSEFDPRDYDRFY